MNPDETTATEPLRRTDPRVERSRAAILAAAMERFLIDGYDADLDDIAQDAGVSKKTIYNVIGSKERLFRETLPSTLSAAERLSAELRDSLIEAHDVEAALRQVAVRLSEVVLSEPILNLRRLLIGVADRFPTLVRDYYEHAPGLTIARLADAFVELNRRGSLDIDDPTMAADHFAYLAVGASLDRALFGVGPYPAAGATASERAVDGAAAFYRAYRPRNPAR